MKTRIAAPRRLTLQLAVVATLAAAGPASIAQAQVRDALGQFAAAVRADDRGFVNRMASLGLDESSRDALRNNLLMLAIRENGRGLALELLKQPVWQTKEILEYENQLGETALMLAAMGGSLPVVTRLVELGAEINRAGWSALHYAASAGKDEVIRFLADRSAYVDSASPNGTTPLMMAARFNHRSSAQLLLDLGADPTLTNEAGFTARDYALTNNNRALAFWLEMEEITFTHRYLSRLPKAEGDDVFEEMRRPTLGNVITVNPDGTTTIGPIQAAPQDNVEVFKGIK